MLVELSDNLAWILINGMFTRVKHGNKYTESEAHCDSEQNSLC